MATQSPEFYDKVFASAKAGRKLSQMQAARTVFAEEDAQVGEALLAQLEPDWIRLSAAAGDLNSHMMLAELYACGWMPLDRPAEAYAYLRLRADNIYAKHGFSPETDRANALVNDLEKKLGRLYEGRRLYCQLSAVVWYLAKVDAELEAEAHRAESADDMDAFITPKSINERLLVQAWEGHTAARIEYATHYLDLGNSVITGEPEAAGVPTDWVMLAVAAGRTDAILEIARRYGRGLIGLANSTEAAAYLSVAEKKLEIDTRVYQTAVESMPDFDAEQADRHYSQLMTILKNAEIQEASWQKILNRQDTQPNR